MFRMPFLIAALVMGSGLAWTIHLIVDPTPWEADAALAIAIGCLVLSIVAMAALLLGRGRWTRFFAAGLVVVEMFIAVVADFDYWMVAAVALGGLSVAGLGGPWFKGWLRERPAAGSPGWQPIALSIAAFALVPAVGVVSPSGLQPAHGIAGAAGILLSWGYLKATIWALLGLRFAMPVVVVAAAISSPILGGAVLVAHGALLAYLAWSKEARLAVDPLPELPAPRRRRK